MALIKVLIIFVVILALLNKRLPLYLAMIFGSLLMIVMFRLRCTQSRAGMSGQ